MELLPVEEEEQEERRESSGPTEPRLIRRVREKERVSARIRTALAAVPPGYAEPTLDPDPTPLGQSEGTQRS